MLWTRCSMSSSIRVFLLFSASNAVYKENKIIKNIVLRKVKIIQTSILSISVWSFCTVRSAISAFTWWGKNKHLGDKFDHDDHDLFICDHLFENFISKICIGTKHHSFQLPWIIENYLIDLQIGFDRHQFGLRFRQRFRLRGIDFGIRIRVGFWFFPGLATWIFWSSMFLQASYTIDFVPFVMSIVNKLS